MKNSSYYFLLSATTGNEVVVDDIDCEIENDILDEYSNNITDKLLLDGHVADLDVEIK